MKCFPNSTNFFPSYKSGVKIGLRFREHFVVEESDCTVVSDVETAIETAKRQLLADRNDLKRFIKENPAWQASFKPLTTHSEIEIIKIMENAAEICDVGPMAAVAGALADRMQHAMIIQNHSRISVVENGGEIAIKSNEDIIIGLYILTHALKAKIGFKYIGNSPNLGVATSSGTFGHAKSLGQADAVTIFAKDAGIADAAATRFCNAVSGPDIEKAILRGLEHIDDIPEISAAFIAYRGKVGTKGKLPEFVRIESGEEYILREKFDSL
jgi:ApbE superfamily uncharacterized protein (UPF0280 family)